MGFDAHELVTGTYGWMKYAGYAPSKEQIQRVGKTFLFTNSETGRPLVNRTCIVKFEGKFHELMTDKSGRVFIEAMAGDPISVHLVFEAPTGEMKCEA